MKCLVYYLISLLLLCSSSLGDNGGNCIIDGVTDFEWKQIKSLDAAPQNQPFLLAYKYTGTLSLDSATVDLNPYFSATTNNTHVIINNSTDLIKIDKSLSDYTPSPYNGLNGNINFVCEKGKSVLTVVFNIIDSNDYLPEFSEKSYSVMLPMPMLPIIDINQLLGDQMIQARDEDFSNNNMKFSIEPSYFEITTKNLGSKTYQPVIKVKKVQRLEKNTTFTIKAQDNGTPPKSSSVSFTIKVDAPNSVPSTPQFSKALYEFKYTKQSDGSGSLTTNDTIQITTDTNNLTVWIDGDYKKYFYETYDSKNVIVDISLQDKSIPEEILNATDKIILTVSAQIANYNHSSAAILVNLPLKPGLPVFSKSYFSYQYCKNGSLTGDVIEVLEDDVKVSLTGEEKYAAYFQLQTVGKKYSLQVAKGKNLDDLITTEVSLTIQAKRDGDGKSGNAAVVVKLPQINLIPQIEKTRYEASYTSDNKIVMTGSIKILNKNPKNVLVTLTGDYTSNFNLIPDNTSSQYTLNVLKPLTSFDEDYIEVTIQASLGEVATYSTITINLPKKEIPVFSKVHYTGVARTGQDKTVTIKDGPIALNNKQFEATKVNISEGDTTLFDVNRDAKNKNQWNVILKKELPGDQSEYILTLEASLDTQFDLCVLVVNVIAEDPIFSSVLYTASSLGSPSVISFKEGAITLLNQNYEYTTISIINSDCSKNFSIARNKTDKSKWILSITSQLDINRKEFALTLQANLWNNGWKNASVLITIFNKQAELEFSSPTYTTTYDGINPVLNFNEGAISIFSTNFTGTKAVITNDKANIFNLKRDDKNSSQWIMTVSKPLSMYQNHHFTLTLEASLDDLKSYSTAVITIPNKEKPVWSKQHYSGSYDIKKNKVYLDDGPIALGNKNAASTKVQFVKGDDGFFNLIRNNNSLNQFDLTPNHVPSDDQKLVLTMQANLNGVTSNAVLVVLLNASVEIMPKFSSPIYTASYIIGDDKHASVVMNGSIQVGPIGVQVNVAIIDGDYEDDFSLAPINNAWTVVLKNPLPVNISRNELALTIQALVINGTQKDLSVVVISLPSKEEQLIQFDEPVYEAIYQSSKTGNDVLVLDGKISLKHKEGVISVPNVTVLDYVTNFNAKYCKDGSVNVTLINNLDDKTKKKGFITVILDASVNTETKDIYHTFTVLAVQLNTTQRSLVFEKPVYVNKTTTDYKGILQKVTATIDGKESDKIIYSIIGVPPKGVTIDPSSGIISTTSRLKPGAFQLNVNASDGIKSNDDMDQTAVVIYVHDSTSLRPQFTLEKLNISENKKNSSIYTLSKQNTTVGVSYTITSISSSFKDYFAFKENSLVQLEAIDREDPVFAEMFEAEIVLTLQACYKDDCEGKSVTELESDNQEGNWMWLNTSIPNNPEGVILVLRITDENDNEPKFDDDRIVIGYPNKKVALEVISRSLTIVKATDPDEGINAELAYSVDSDKVFIDPVSGEIYPTNDLFSQTHTKFNVYATDQNGAGQKSKPLEVEVKLLDEENIIILERDNLKLSDVPAELNKLKKQANYKDISALASTIVPSSSSDSLRTSKLVTYEETMKNSAFTTRIIAYAIDSDEDLVKEKDFQKAIPDSAGWSVSKWSGDNRDNSSSSDRTGLLAAIGVLTFIIVVILAAAITFYMVKLRKIMGIHYKNMEEESSMDTSTRNSSDEIRYSKNIQQKVSFSAIQHPSEASQSIANRRPTGYVRTTIDFNDINEDDTEYERIEDTKVENPFEASEMIDFGDTEIKVVDFKEASDRRKSVAFDDNVEKHHIEKNSEENDDDEESSDL